MRSLTAGERTLTQASRLTPHLKVEVQNASGTWKDLGALLGADYVVTGNIDVALDAAVSSASFALRRKVGVYSLSPLIIASALNIDDASAYAPLLDIGRLVRASSATTEPDYPPAVNSVIWSQDQTNAAWVKAFATVPAQTAVGPDGVAGSLATFVESNDGGVSQSHIVSGPSVAITAGAAQSLQGVFRARARSNVLFYLANGAFASNRIGATVNMTLGTATVFQTGTGVVSSLRVVNLGGGLYRVEIVGVLGTDTLGSPIVRAADAGGSGAYIGTGATAFDFGWIQHQVDASFVGSYVQTGATAASSYKEGFTGRIDSVAWESDPITIACSDLGAWLMDTQIEVEGTQYGTTPTGTALQTVIQNILNAWPSGKGIPTLFTPTSPGYLVTSWAQGRTKVLDAIRAVALQSTGWDVRFRYDASHVSRLTLFNPDRTRVTVDATIAASEYRNVKALSLSIANVRNVGKLPYTDASGAPQSVVYPLPANQATDPSVVKYGRRYFELASSNAITTSGQANALIASVVSDLAGAPAEQEIVTSFLWFVQLYDRYTFVANGVHYDQDQTLAVVGYRHEFGDGVAWTTLRCAGRVVGAYADWLRGIALRLEVIEPSISAVATETATTGTLVLTPTDPQGRLTRVQMATASGNGALSAYADVPLVGGVYTGTVPLVEKQPSKIAWRMYAAVGNSEQLQDGDVVRFAIGGIPLAPEVSYQIDAAGMLSVIVKGDSSTTNNRVVIATDGPPTDAQVDASTSLIGRNSSVTRQLAAGERYYIASKSYNTALGGTVASQGSPLVPQTDQWLGPSSSRATVRVNGASASPSVITLWGVGFGDLTTHINVYVREYRTDPGTFATVALTGYRLGPPRTRTWPILIPVANPSNYIVVTLEAVDALNRVGVGAEYGLALSAGTLTLKIQAAAVVGTIPNSPTGASVDVTQVPLVTLGVVMPLTNLPATVRWRRDGVVVGEVAAGAPGATVLFALFSEVGTFTVSYTGVSATGAESTPVAFSYSYSTTTLATPSLVVGAWDSTKRGFDVTVTPGAGTPPNTTWFFDHSANGTTWTSGGQSSTTTFFHAHDVDGTAHNHFYRVLGSAVGFLASAYAYDGGGASPGTNRPIPATA